MEWNQSKLSLNSYHEQIHAIVKVFSDLTCYKNISNGRLACYGCCRK